MSVKLAPLDATPKDPRILIVIPTYNNRRTLRQVAKEALTVGVDVLVVNDGSTDGGPGLLASLALSRLDLPVNQGKGAAILAAAAWAEERGYTHLITLDADGQHAPREAARFIEAIQANPWSIVVGTRDFASIHAPRLSRFGRHFSNFWLKLAAGASVPDSQSGFRAYPTAALRQIPCTTRRYDFEVEILVRAAWAGLRLASVEVSTCYQPAEGRVSHFRLLRDNLRISRAYARCVTRNFIPWPHKKLGPAAAGEEQLSFRHLGRSLRILLRENSSPREIATASMLGIFLGTLPLLACHSVVIVFCATRLRLNRLMALNISHLCAPPLVPALAIEAGYYLRHGRFLTQFNLHTLAYQAHQRLLDYLIGSLLVGPVLAMAIGLVAYSIALLYQRSSSRKGARNLG